MITIQHQLKNEQYYIPNWPIKFLFLGTFNPQGGENVNYYYGREKNQTWTLLSEIFKTSFNPRDSNFLDKIKKYGIGCIDMIDEVRAPQHFIENINGKGYKDSKIINKVVERTYNTTIIQGLILKNPNVKVFSTWGKGSNLKEWKNEINKIENLISLVSPSLAARVPQGESKFQFMLDDWKSKILIS